MQPDLGIDRYEDGGLLSPSGPGFATWDVCEAGREIIMGCPLFAVSLGYTYISEGELILKQLESNVCSGWETKGLTVLLWTFWPHGCL